MSARSLISLLVLEAGCASAGAIQVDSDDEVYDPPVRQVNATFGGAFLDDSAWDDIDEPYTIGLDFTQDIRSRWVFLEGGFHYAHDSVNRLDGDVKREFEINFYDFSGGFLWQWPRPSSVRPYAGLGGALVFAEGDVDPDIGIHDDDDAAVGAYGKLGILFSVSPDSHVGFEVRAVEGGTVSTEVGDGSIDSVQLSLVFGAAF